MRKNNRPIGVFDSGLGGLTVLRQLRRILPRERFIYFGDTARVPYGSKSPETVRRYSAEIVRFLVKKNVKMVVVACNTSSALALKDLKKKFPIPICGVVEPGAALALRKSISGRIGIIGTEATIKSQIYPITLKALAGDRPIEVFGLATPLLVPLVEEGITAGPIANLIIKNYLGHLWRMEIDVLILGCTHYPLLKNTIRKILDKNIVLVDSALAVAEKVKDILAKNNLAIEHGRKLSPEFYVTDSSEKFRQLGQRFLREKISDVHLIKFL